MNNMNAVTVTKPIKVDVVRIEEMFYNSYSYKSRMEGIVKNYLYIPEKRVIA